MHKERNPYPVCATECNVWTRLSKIMTCNKDGYNRHWLASYHTKGLQTLGLIHAWMLLRCYFCLVYLYIKCMFIRKHWSHQLLIPENYDESFVSVCQTEIEMTSLKICIHVLHFATAVWINIKSNNSVNNNVFKEQSIKSTKTHNVLKKYTIVISK